jgi:uncharacterized protein (TIGR00288 family)
MVMNGNNEDVVVFFDFENIVYSLRYRLKQNPNFELLMDKCQEYGRVVLARAYADWSRHSTVIAPLQASGFDPMYVPTYFYDKQERPLRKNAVDIHIAIEAVEVMYTQPHINTFILLTGDKDFIPLANALRRHGKNVIAIGVQGTTSAYMRQATDDFIFYHQLLDDPAGKKPEPPKKDIYTVLVDAVKKLQREQQKTVFPQVKHTMSEMLGSFDEKDYKDAKGIPFNRFKDFILEAQRLGHVKFVTTGSVNEVLLPGDKVKTTEEPALQPIPPIKESVTPEPQPLPLSPPPEKVTDLETGFELLVWAVNHAQAEGKSPRASSIKTIMRKACHDFDEKQLDNEKGEKFTKFSDFTRAASQRGLVQIRGKGIKMEIHPGQVLKPVPAISPTPETAEESGPSKEDLSASEDLFFSSTEPYVSDYRLRVVVVDALRDFKTATKAPDIARHCLDLSKQRGIPLPRRRLNQLLTAARDLGLLMKTSGEDGAPDQYTFVEDGDLVSRFLGAED